MDLSKLAGELQPRSMAARDWVYQVIHAAIIRGILPGGMPLRQEEISAALNVSHIPVREAFRQLEAQGLVRIYPNKGAVVTKLSKKEMSDAMDTRILLEVGALRTAIPHTDLKQIQLAYQCLDEFSISREYYVAAQLNLKLHFSLYETCGNQMLLSLVEQLHGNVDRYLSPYFSELDTSQLYSVEDHRQLIEACEQKDIELATAILRTHLQSTKNLLMASPLL